MFSKIPRSGSYPFNPILLLWLCYQPNWNPNLAMFYPSTINSLYGFKKTHLWGEILFISLTSLFIQNYYFGFYDVYFLILWYLACHGTSKELKLLLHFVINYHFISYNKLTARCYINNLHTHERIFRLTVSCKKSWYLSVFTKKISLGLDTTKYMDQFQWSTWDYFHF